MPAINIYLICVCLVSEPKSLKFGIVNHEGPIIVHCMDVGDICIIANLSCRYIHEFGSSTLIQVNPKIQFQKLQSSYCICALYASFIFFVGGI